MGMRASRFGSVVFVVISLLAALCYNPQLYATGVSPLAAVPVLLLHLALAVTFGGIPGLRWGYFLFLHVAGCALTYFYTLFDVSMSYDTLAWLLETNRAEVDSFVTWPLFLLLCAGIAVSLVHSSLSQSFRASLAGRRYAAMAGLLLLCALVSAEGGRAAFKHLGGKASYEALSMSRIVPVSVVKAAAAYVREERRSDTLAALPDPADAASSLVIPDHEKPVVVFIIGESARADHFGINGYERDTTPRLSLERNIINYGVCRSFANTTRISLIGILTDATIEDRTPRHGSFISLFNKHGYDTAFFSRQNRLGRSGHLTDALVSGAGTVEYLKGVDRDLVTRLQAFVANAGGKLVVLHTQGSHFSYNQQYAAEHRRFMPDTYSNEAMPRDIANVINAYDNSIVKTDAMIAETIDVLRDRNAVVLYTSDHGESLGENGVFFHGTKKVADEQYEVPLFLWYSDVYEKSRPDVVARLRRVRGTPVTHDFIYHTLLGLGGIRSTIASASHDLSGVTAQPLRASGDEAVALTE